jgi:hypothetical protein
MIDAKAFGQELAQIVKGQLAPLLSRMDALEKRFDNLPVPQDGKDADPEQIVSRVTVKLNADLSSIREALSELDQKLPHDIKMMVDEAVAAIPVPKDGKSVSIEDVAPLIASEVEKCVSELPKPKDGEPGRDGTSVDPAEVQRRVSEAVDKAVAAIPAPKDGADGKDGKDGVGLAGAIIDRAGELVVTLTNGETKSLGPVVGKDGAPGEKGLDGKDGRDGFGFEDLDLAETDEGIALRFMRSDHVKEFRLPVVLDRGVYKEGQTYRPGDGVTWGGSFWICLQETTDKPNSGKGFRLAVKKGRDGRDGVMKEAKANEPVRVGVPGKVV